MNTTLVENQYGHGALPLRRDLRDHKYKKLAMASQPFDWTKGYDAETTPAPTKDQGGSFSCGGQSGSYLEAMTKPLFSERSAKYIYSQIFYPGGGTTLRDILKFLVNSGAAAEKAVPSYLDNTRKAPTEAFMTNKSLNQAGADSAFPYEAAGYAFVEPNIDAYAQAIRDNGGAIMQINGANNGTWLSLEPKPPVGNSTWSHFLVCTGAALRNGVKTIKVHNSWGDDTGDGGYQYIDEAYFNSGNVLQGGVIYSKVSPLINNQDKITIIQKIMALCQQLIDLLSK